MQYRSKQAAQHFRACVNRIAPAQLSKVHAWHSVGREYRPQIVGRFSRLSRETFALHHRYRKQ
jgi:hypothetical protein